MANLQNLMEIIVNEEMENVAIEGLIANLNNVDLDGEDEDWDELLRAIAAIEMDDNDLLEVRPRGYPLVVIKNYFEEVIPFYMDDTFQSHFRMSRTTVEQLENVIRQNIHDANDAPNYQPNNNQTNTIPLLKKILLTIWLLATNETFRSVCDRFGVTKIDGHNTFVEIVVALVDLMPEYIKLPTADERNVNEAVFLQRRPGFTGVIGAMDGCHIQITQPPGNSHDYYNRHDHHSIILQGTCDHSGKFIDVLIGRPGRAHDAAVFRSSPLYEKLIDEENPLLLNNQHILADSAYPLLQNVLTPYRDNGHLTIAETRFNVRHASLRSIIERSFGLLKIKWQRLLYCLHVKSVRMGNTVIAACCVLHNFLLIHNEANIFENINTRANENINDGEEADDDDDDDDDIERNAHQKRDHIRDSLR